MMSRTPAMLRRHGSVAGTLGRWWTGIITVAVNIADRITGRQQELGNFSSERQQLKDEKSTVVIINNKDTD